MQYKLTETSATNSEQISSALEKYFIEKLDILNDKVWRVQNNSSLLIITNLRVILQWTSVCNS